MNLQVDTNSAGLIIGQTERKRELIHSTESPSKPVSLRCERGECCGEGGTWSMAEWLLQDKDDQGKTYNWNNLNRWRGNDTVTTPTPIPKRQQSVIKMNKSARGSICLDKRNLRSHYENETDIVLNPAVTPPTRAACILRWFRYESRLDHHSTWSRINPVEFSRVRRPLHGEREVSDGI